MLLFFLCNLWPLAIHLVWQVGLGWAARNGVVTWDVMFIATSINLLGIGMWFKDGRKTVA